ncbi:MAG TPA: DUF2442 domain-containing protein [Leptolyngbya sp.]|jgi:hypothetical protein|nr:DUF2442 domain-containing protein [Leptolyngbya sp.]
MAQKSWKKEVTEAQIEEQISNAKAAWIEAASVEPRAVSVSFDPQKLIYAITLTNDACFSFPAPLIREIAEASSEDLSDVHLSGSGNSIHWEKLGVDFSIPGIICRILGTKVTMSELAKQGGKKTSKAKSEAARQNGKKGGRPRKKAIAI